MVASRSETPYYDEAQLSPGLAPPAEMRENGSISSGSKYDYHAVPSPYASNEHTPLPHQTRKSRKWLVGLGVGLVVVAAAIAIPVGVVYGNKSHNDQQAATNIQQAALAPVSIDSVTGQTISISASSAAPAVSAAPVAGTVTTLGGGMTGTNGSTIYPMNGTSQTFTYINNWGGRWAAMPGDFSARPQDDVPPLSTAWDWTQNTVRGMNLGGWFVMEPFICGNLFERFLNSSNQAIDEWSLCENLDAVSATEKQRVMEDHYSTFITEDDFMNIAGAGFNYLRIPLGFWALEIWDGEPYYNGSWPHFLNALEWARKYGLRVQIDMHGLPGSQNGWDHSGRRTFDMGWMRGQMGIANAQRSLNYVRMLTEFVMQPQVAPIVGMLGLVNEVLIQAASNGAGFYAVEGYYAEAYRVVRNITGTAGPYIVIHDGFAGTNNFFGFMDGADRVILDSHPYLSFQPQNNNPLSQKANDACQQSYIFRTASQSFGVTVGGEWSLAINDCSTYLNGIGLGTRFDGTYPTASNPTYPYVGSCDTWNDWENWSEDRKAGFRTLTLAWMDSLQHFFFWTWKTNPLASLGGSTPNPMWNYQLGLRQNYVPRNIRNATGTCNNLFGDGTFPDPVRTLRPTSASVQLPSWPPSIGQGGNTYTPTGTQKVLAVYTPTAFPSGANSASVAALMSPTPIAPRNARPFYAPVQGQSYPPQWQGEHVSYDEGFVGGQQTMR